MSKLLGLVWSISQVIVLIIPSFFGHDVVWMLNMFNVSCCFILGVDDPFLRNFYLPAPSLGRVSLNGKTYCRRGSKKHLGCRSISLSPLTLKVRKATCPANLELLEH